MINFGSLLVGGLISSSVGLIAGFSGIDSKIHRKIFYLTRANNNQFSEETRKLYQQAMIEDRSLALKLLWVFPLVHASGALAGGFIAKKLEQEFGLQGTTEKEVCRVGIIYLITAIFTFCFTKSVGLSAINSAVTARWQWKNPVLR